MNDRRATKPPGSIGSARMLEDGTLILDLRATDASGRVGDARLYYPKSHRQYREILDHLGPMKPGETRPVPPWPERR